MERLSSLTINTGDLVTALKGLGISVGKPKFVPRSAHLTVGEIKALDPIVDSEGPILQESEEVPGETEGEDWVAEVFQVAKRKQRPPPKEFFFPKSDMLIRMSCPLPSPCRICGGKKHWDKECPHFDAYKLKMKKQAKLVEGVDGEEAYHLVYEVTQHFERAAVQVPEPIQEGLRDSQCKADDNKKVEIEVVEDDDEKFWKKRGYAANYILKEAEKGELDRYVATSAASLAHKSSPTFLGSCLGARTKQRKFEKKGSSLAVCLQEPMNR
ncbi:uncharacterized protein ARMOST_11672 [Armillaria ostoyae]|uniref:CCHC-type domain-containing protein n=1 Tax=Armillaria ostoyae TaxID=47428 RepID=A0A284RHS2_ARMOS|nr:uncharacterized protein ARMOST_11672 [Armillaria ostoyae]